MKFIKQIEGFIERNKQGAMLGALVGGALFLTRDKAFTLPILQMIEFDLTMPTWELFFGIMAITVFMGILIDAYYKPKL